MSTLLVSAPDGHLLSGVPMGLSSMLRPTADQRERVRAALAGLMDAVTKRTIAAPRA
ncbi:MAG: hypothetical protein ACR2L2_07420 [Acidobacteriota bacterium]